MPLDIDILAELADVDDAISDATRKRDAARASVPGAQEALDAAEAEVLQAKDALAAHKAEELATERKVKEYTTHVARANRALETGTGDADAAERQRLKCLAIIDDLETTQLGQMDTREALEARLAEAESAAQARREALAAAEVASAPAVREQLSRLNALVLERGQIRAQLHAEELRRYDALMVRKRRPVSPLIGDTCKACNRVQVARVIQDLKRGMLVQCAGCGRWLHAPDLVITPE